MASYLIDSDVLIDYLNGKTQAVRLLKGLITKRGLLHISPINVTEVITGTPPEKRSDVITFLRSFQLVAADFEIADQAGRYIFDYARQGIQLALSDATLAATAKFRRLILVSRNIKHYPMNDIVLYPG